MKWWLQSREANRTLAIAVFEGDEFVITWLDTIPGKKCHAFWVEYIRGWQGRHIRTNMDVDVEPFNTENPTHVHEAFQRLEGKSWNNDVLTIVQVAGPRKGE